MISALFYLQFHSVLNRLTMRFKRLKQPKYLIGAIVGGIYFSWYIFGVLLSPRGWAAMNSATPKILPKDPLFYESIGALILFVIVFLAWVFPHQRASLVFTEAEIAFLFPAPVSRRGLIHFKLLRSQLGMLVTVLFFTFISSRFGVRGHWLVRAAGWWVILFTLNLHFLGSSFAMTMLMDRGISNWKRRLAVFALTLAALGFVVIWGARAIPEFAVEKLNDLEALADYARQLLVSGPLPYLLYPFRLVVKPYLARDALGFLAALWPALLLMAAHYFWVMRSNVAFEEASVEASKRMSEKIAAVRSGKWGATGKQLKRKRDPFKLRPTGLPFIALLWKNLISAGSAFTARMWIILAVGALVVSSSVLGMAGSSGWQAAIAGMSGMFSVWAVLIGPQMMRQDFRQDLPNADVLKIFPMRGWQIALGEILAPAVILTAVQWLLLILAVTCGMPLAHGEISRGLVLSLGTGAVVVLPAWNLVSFIIPNAAVLQFPSWFQTGKEAPQGIEAMGQRMIFALGQFFVLFAALLPAGLVFTGVFFLLKIFAGVPLAIPVASVAAALVLTLEAGLGVMLLGRLFERLDLSAEQTA